MFYAQDITASSLITNTRNRKKQFYQSQQPLNQDDSASSYKNSYLYPFVSLEILANISNTNKMLIEKIHYLLCMKYKYKVKSRFLVNSTIIISRNGEKEISWDKFYSIFHLFRLTFNNVYLSTNCPIFMSEIKQRKCYF